MFIHFQAVQSSIYDNFTRKGYSPEDIDLRTGPDGQTVREVVKAAVRAHRRDPENVALGARRYQEIRQNHPKSDGLDLPLPDDNAEVVREGLEAALAPCKSLIMKKRPELLDCLLSLEADSVNCVELNEIISIFVRLNPRNPSILNDAWTMLLWFTKLDIRSSWPEHHKLIQVHCGSVIKQV